MTRPPLPPFTAESAAQKARLAEDAWNTRDPAKVALAYSEDSIWRNRAEFIALIDAPGQEQTSFAAAQNSDFIKHVRA
jgi:nuclear transport factor 2 (NTF2) superfamily protein